MKPEYNWLCRRNDLRTGKPSQSLFLIGQFQKVETPTLLMFAHRLVQHQENCPMRFIFIASNPLKERQSRVERTESHFRFGQLLDESVQKAPLGCSNTWEHPTFYLANRE